MDVLAFAVIFWIIPMFVANAIGKSKRRAGFLYGFFLGWLGVLVVALLPPTPPMTLERLEKMKGTITPKRYEEARAELLATVTHRECTYCREQIRRDASVCPHCQREVDPWYLHEGRWWRQVGGQWEWRDELSGAWTPAAPAAGE